MSKISPHYTTIFEYDAGVHISPGSTQTLGAEVTNLNYKIPFQERIDQQQGRIKVIKTVKLKRN